MAFIDARGREWRPRMTVRVVRDFETRTGIGLFDVVFDALGGNAKSSANKQATQIAQKLFGSISNTAFLLYESCRDSQGQVCDFDGNSVTYDDFCDGIGAAEISSAISEAMQVLLNFFPAPDINAQGRGKETRPTNAGLGAGGTSTS